MKAQTAKSAVHADVPPAPTKPVMEVKADAPAGSKASSKPSSKIPPKGAEPATAAKPATVTLKKKPHEVTKKTRVEPVPPAVRSAASEAPKPPVSVPPKPAAGSPQLSPLGVPIRSGRPSSRLAQLTVPSMAQSVASTAAKSSFSQITPVQPITPVTASAVKKDPALADNWRTKSVDQLTDAEVIAMSDDDYMNDAQMAFFRLKLVNLKNGILSNAGETTEHLREDTVVVPDPADRATIEEEHALELRTRDRERKLLKKIEQSINRIDAGDYGYCDETGEPIGVGRLIARPTATLSLEAQQRRELKQKMFGD